MQTNVSTFEPYFVDDIYYQESTFLTNMQEHEALLVYDLCEQECFLEDGDENGEKKSTNLIMRLIQIITETLGNIGRAIQGFFDGLRNDGKHNLTPEQYFQSETGSLDLDADIMDMQEKIDDEYLACRNVIQKISKKTGMDAKTIASINDLLANKVHEKRYEIGKGIKATVEMSQAARLSKKCIKNLRTMEDDRRELDALLRFYKTEVQTKDSMQHAHNKNRKDAIKTLKRNGINYKKDPRYMNNPMLQRIGIMERLSVKMAHLTNAEIAVHRHLSRAAIRRKGKQKMRKYTK